MAGVVTSRHRSGLVLVEQSVEARALDRELKKLDSRLFLERHLLEDGRPIWTVQIQLAGDQPPRTVCYWSDDRFEPLPLTWRLLDRVKQLDGGFDRLADRIFDHNERVEARAKQAIREAVEEAAGDVYPRAFGRKRTLLHRGGHLRMARDKRRAKGEKC